MFLSFVDHANDVSFELTVPDELARTLALQWERLGDHEAHAAFRKRLQRQIEGLLIQCLDWDLRPPSQAQINFAMSIARRLQLNIPASVLTQAGAMANFLDEHAERFKEFQRIGDSQF